MYDQNCNEYSGKYYSFIIILVNFMRYKNSFNNCGETGRHPVFSLIVGIENLINLNIDQPNTALLLKALNLTSV